MLTPYDEIELFGLTENGSDDLPIPNDDELQGRAVGEAFEALSGTLHGTGLASEVEPLAHAFATMFQRRATVTEEAADRLKDKIAALICAQDGSEVAEVELSGGRVAGGCVTGGCVAGRQEHQPRLRLYQARCRRRNRGGAWCPCGDLP